MIDPNMFCPKCKQSFDEGSRRFCPTDGTRLVSENADVRSEGGIFANLIPQMSGLSELTEQTPDIPRFVVTEPNGTTPSNDNFFELDDIKLEMDEDVILKPVRSAPIVEAPMGR